MGDLLDLGDPPAAVTAGSISGAAAGPTPAQSPMDLLGEPACCCRCLCCCQAGSSRVDWCQVAPRPCKTWLWTLPCAAKLAQPPASAFCPHVAYWAVCTVNLGLRITAMVTRSCSAAPWYEGQRQTQPWASLCPRRAMTSPARTLLCHVAGGLGELNLGQSAQAAAPAAPAAPAADADPFSALSRPAPQQQQQQATPAQSSLPVLLAADKGKGLTIRGQVVQQDGQTGGTLVP